ncbi:hypothetical protein PEX1_010720 [Penicillium expansum]|uniref:Uncharacterized protein n=1 Tax=Penicillium expansum TaxID=27334 RepID=A0A0A2KUT1_PENEN|nr:hypothetical protein PEX2_058590 [Penicillium expansum]KGO40021.1 hypothetical protein PEXP_034040 [Penicillium expansum]KGO53215.1 hypothetical protein PEX2_058590 [Penicillium expansum]KGO70648.1 hypothetical protein PEX1_010720 [Penicillium expansum]
MTSNYVLGPLLIPLNLTEVSPAEPFQVFYLHVKSLEYGVAYCYYYWPPLITPCP